MAQVQLRTDTQASCGMTLSVIDDLIVDAVHHGKCALKYMGKLLYTHTI